MRNLETQKTRLIFETASTVREAGKTRAVTVQAEPRYALVGLKRTKEKFMIPWDALYHLGVKWKVEAARKEKAATKAKKGRK